MRRGGIRSRRIARLVGQANLGAVPHEGGAEWPWFDGREPTVASLLR